MNPPTLEQLLNLADRAEFNGGLTQAEADRLRFGLRHLDHARRSAARRGSANHRVHTERSQRLAAIERLVRRTTQRGAKTVTVWGLVRILTEPTEEAA
ncbi:hypothetical protein ABZ958_03285 [Streptomyces sp. NPDC046237]|uniref:hypothetical protein n=1 Tax=Streptomyces sp. NPDC046237 TaxID=3154914 RepID=UPI0034035DDF